MPTFEEVMTDRLFNSAMWPEEIAAVLAEVKDSPEMDAMRDRWGDSIEEYPVMVPICWIAVEARAIEWLTANKPDHFALEVLKGVRDAAAGKPVAP